MGVLAPCLPLREQIPANPEGHADSLSANTYNQNMGLAFVLPALLLELLLLYTGGKRLSSRLLTWTLAAGGVKRFLGWCLLMPGTAVHELSHALFAVILGGRIHSFVPFRPVAMEDGSVQLGYVEHSNVRGGPIGGAIVGMAPLIGVPLSIWGLGLLMLPVSGQPIELLQWVIQNPLSLGPLWILISLPLSLGALPSPSDHRDLPVGGLLLAAILTVLFLLGVVSSGQWLEAPLRGFAQLLLIPALFSLLGFMRRR